MTDKYQDNNDMNQYAEGNAGEQHDVWQDQNPPADDFADVQDEASVQVEGEEGLGAEQQAGTDAAPKKKASMLLPVGVGVAGLIFLGGMVYMQFFSGVDVPVSAVQTATSPSTPQQVPSQQAMADAGSTAAPMPNGLPFDPTQLKQPDGATPPVVAPVAPEHRPALTGMPAPALQSETALPTKQPDAAALVQPNTVPAQPSVLDSMAAGQPVVAPNTAAPVTTAGNSVPLPAKATAEAPKTPAIATPPQVTSAPTAAVQSATPNTIASGSMADQQARSRIDEMQRSLDKLSQQMAQVGDVVTNIHSAPTAPSGLEERLAKLEQELIKLQQMGAAKGAKAVEPRPAAHAAAKNTSMDDFMGDVAPRQTVKKAKAATTKKSATKTESKSRLVLRAATPGEAWVAVDAASANLKQVRVGDQLSGLGEVTSIHQDDKGWVVQGTKGVLR